MTLIVNIKKFLLPVVAVFGVITVFDLVFHELIMNKTYLDYSHLFRPQDEIHKHQNLMHLANLTYSFVFCYIYSKGHEAGKGIAQGIRFALWITLLIWLPSTIVNHVIFAYPKILVISWFIGYTMQTVLAGITVSVTYKS